MRRRRCADHVPVAMHHPDRRLPVDICAECGQMRPHTRTGRPGKWRAPDWYAVTVLPIARAARIRDAMERVFGGAL